MTARGRLGALALLVVALVAGACGDDGGSSGGDAGSPSSTTGAAASTTTLAPKVGGALTMAVYSEPSGLDPVVPQGGGTGGNHELGAIYDTLMRYDPDAKTYVPQLAEALTANADSTEWTLKLRAGVKFSDGTDFDADAVVFGMKRHTQYGSTLAGQVASIKDYAVVDKTTVKFTLTSSWPGFAYVLSNTPGMIPSPSAVKAACPDLTKPARDCTFNTKPIGAGPFVVDSYKPKEALVLKRNPTYWGGQVYLDTLRFVPPQAAGIIYEQVKNDAIQVAFLRDAETIKKAADEKAVNSYTVLQGFGGIVLMNNGQITCKKELPAAVCGGKPDGIIDLGKPTGDVRVRQAIAYALDPKQLDQRMTNGSGYPGSEFFQKSDRYGSLGPSATFDPAKAKALVEEYKKEKNWDGSLSVSCLQEQSTSAPFVQTVQAMLNAVGFNVTTDLKPSTEYITRIQTTRNYDLACWGFNVGEEAPEAGLARHVLSVAGGNAGGNAMNLNNPEIDAQIKAVREGKTDAEKKAALQKLLDIWKVQQPSMVYSNNGEVIASGKKVHGLKYNVATSVLFDKAWVG
jgi:peptide/nickel transport system substrate-binding protein